MSDPLIALFDPLLGPLTRRVGLRAACAGIARLLNAAALDAMCGHHTHGDRLVETVGGRDASPTLRRMLVRMVTGRRQLWPADRRILRHWAIEDVAGGVSLETECEDLDDAGAARLAAQMLVDVPPASVTELRARLAGLSRPAVRDALFEQLTRDGCPEETLDILCAAFEAVDGPGRNLRRLATLAADEAQPAPHREAAWRVVVSCPETEVSGALDLVDLAVQQDLTALGTAAMLRRLLSHPEGGAGLIRHLEDLDAGDRRDLLIGIEDIRRIERMPAAALYGPLVSARSFPEADDILIPALVAGHGPGAEHALATALATETSSDRQAALRRGLLDIRTGWIEPPVETDHVRAWVGLCDGHGSYPVLLATQSERLRYRLATVVVHCEGDLRDGSVIHDLDVIRLDEIVRGYTQFCELTEVSPSMAGAFVAEGLENRTFSSLPVPLQQAVDEVLEHQRRNLFAPDVDPASPPTIRDLRSLYLRPTLQSWFLDAADLRACDIPPPPMDAARAIAWSREHATQVRDPRVRHRLTAMALHLARWAQLTGDPEAARHAAGALDDLEDGGSGLARVLLEHTALTAREALEDGDAALRFGDEDLREDIRSDLLPIPPRGRDLGALDLTDLLVSSGRDLCAGHVDTARIRPDDRRRTLTAAAGALATSLARGVEADLLAVLHGRLADHAVVAGAVEPLATAILATTMRFLHEVCRECPVQCWSHPDAPVGRAWAGPGHPGVTP